MNVFHKVALQGLRKNRTQTAVTIIGVILSAAMIAAVATFGVSLLDYVTRGAVQKYGDWHLAVLGSTPAYAEELAAGSEVESAVACADLGYAALDGGKNPDKPYLYIAGFTPDVYDTLPVNLLTGRLPQNSGEVVIPAHLASNGGVTLAEGDTLTLAVGTRRSGEETLTQNDPLREDESLTGAVERTYTVVGVCQRPAFEARSAPGYTLITAADGPADSVSVFLKLKHPAQAAGYAAAVGAGHTILLNDNVLRFMGVSGDKWFNALLYAVGGIVVAIVMTGSVFLIHNAFSISLNERIQQIGVLASVGATARQLRGMVLFEGLCIGAVGIPLGILVGIASMGGLLQMVAKNFGNILYSGVTLDLVVSPLALAAAVAVSLATILLSAYIPAKKAAAQPVMVCIRQTNEIKVEAKTVRIARWQRELYGLEGTLALKNFKRNSKRYRSVVLSLVLSVVLFLATSAFVTYLDQASEMATVFTTYDISLSSYQMPDYTLDGLYRQLLTVGGVTGGNYQQLCYYRTQVPGEALSDEYWRWAGGDAADGTVPLLIGIQFFDEETWQKLVEGQGLDPADYAGPDGRLLGVAVLPIDDDREHEAEDFDGLFRNAENTLTLTPVAGDGAEGAAQTVEITFCSMLVPDLVIGGAMDIEDTPYYIQVAAPWSRKDTLAADAKVYAKGMTFSSDTPAQTTAEMKQIAEAAGLGVPYTLYDMHNMLAESRNYIFIANVFGYTFIVMISLIAVANVFNTISTNIRLRRRELAMLRSVGMADRSFNRMMRFECAFYGMRALGFGLPLGLGCNVLVCRGMNEAGFEGVTFEMPWVSLAVSITCVLLVVFVTMMYAVRRIRRENIIDALREEMA